MKKPINILIIDDAEEVLNSLKRFFSKQNYNVTVAGNGLEGLKHLETEDARFDLIITDLVMPSISGVAIISIAKKKLPDTPIIAITGWGEHPEALAKEANADIVLEKPFKLPDLEKHVKELLNR
jgi:DNA-binding response OmpR family regulator